MQEAQKGGTKLVAKRHLDALRTSSQLTLLFRQMHKPWVSMITPQEILAVLKRAKVRSVLMGAHGIGGYKEQTRSTDDVDFLIHRKDHAKAIKAIERAFPSFTMEDFKPVTRFTDPASGKVVIDLMKPVDAVYRLAFKYSVEVAGSYSIPDLEMALVAKFAAMISAKRTSQKKHSDASDFIDIVQHNLSAIDFKKLKRLAGKVYQGGGEEILGYIEDVKAGRTLRV